MRSTLTRIAFSLAGAASLAGPAAAQQPAARPSPVPYGVKVSPWPAPPKPSAAPSAFTAPRAAVPPVVYPPSRAGDGPASPFAPPAAPSAKAPDQSHRTLYYRKESNAPVRPSPAAEVAQPVAAAQPPRAEEPPRAEPLPPPRAGTDAPPVRPELGPGRTAQERPDQTKEPIIPRPDELFRLDSERGFVVRENQRRRVVRADPNATQEQRQAVQDDVVFPAHPQLAAAPYTPRLFAGYEVLVEPNYVCFGRLFYEDRNTERYGWTLGPLQPLASTGKFFNDLQWIGYKVFSFPCMKYECSAGLCLPGDPVPQLAYPPGLSLTGIAGQTALNLAIAFGIP